MNVPNKYTEQHTHISSSMFVHKSLLKIAQFNQREQQLIHHISPITLLTLITNITTRSSTGQEHLIFLSNTWLLSCIFYNLLQIWTFNFRIWCNMQGVVRITVLYRFIGNLTIFRAVKEFWKLFRCDKSYHYIPCAAASERAVKNHAVIITGNNIHTEDEN